MGKPGPAINRTPGLSNSTEMNFTTTDARVARPNQKNNVLTEADIIAQFCSAMREHDIHVSPADIRADGKLHRIRAEGDREKTVWYVLHADDRPAGMFGCNRRYGYDTKFTWKADIKRAPLTAAEKRAYRERIERIEAQRAAEDAAASAAAVERANRLWSEAVDCEEHPYLERKGVRAHGVRVGRWEVINQDTGEVRTVTDQALLIPMRDLQKRIHSLQAIMPQKLEGASDKWYLQDGAKEGNFWVIGRPLEHNGKQVIIVCEGYATGASIHEATGHAVIIAFDVPNLLPVAKVWRARFPDAIIIIAADNDQWTLKPVVNPGLTRARECGAEVGSLVAFPPFDAALGATNERGGRAHGPTDFNDLQQLEGREAICGVIDAVLNPSPAVADARADENAGPSRIVLVPTEDEALGADHACECLVRLGGQLREWETAAAVRDAADAVGCSTELGATVFLPYDQFGLELAAKAAAHIFPGVELHILGAPGDEVKAQRVGQRYGALVSQPDCGDDWRGWGEHFLDVLFSRIDAKADTDPAARDFAEQAIEQVTGADDCDPEDDTAPGENPFANSRHFRVLGVDEDTYFFFRKGKRNQVLSIRTSGLSKNALLSLAPMNWWEAVMLDAPSGKFDKDAAVGFLMEAAEAVGIFDPTFTRGRGAWWDEDRLVVHLGDKLMVDGASMELGAIRSEFLYQGGRKIAAPGDMPLNAADGAWLLEMAKSFRWAKPASAPLLCGWLLLSPLCGALRWRPHAWITGGAGSGKTTILNEFVRPLIPAGMDVFANGDSTEAGLRQTLRSDARPILIDESESDTDAAATKMQRILVMIRQSSSDTGAQTYRGTVGGEAHAFQVRSMALLSSIGVALERQQDLERVTVLALRPKREGEATDVQNWPAIRAGLNSIAKDKTLSARLFRRSIDMAPVIMESIDVFTEAAATFFGTAREGDQIGALLAGAWCLVNDRLPTPEEALAEIRRYDWGDYQEGKAEEQDDLVATLMGRPVIRHGGARTSVGKLVARAAGYTVDELEILPSGADSELHNFGMKVKDNYLWFHPKNAELLKLMRETKYSSDLRGRLKRIEGASTKDGIRIGEAATSGILIPVSTALGHRDTDDRVF